jgi:hypothetical protein
MDEIAFIIGKNRRVKGKGSLEGNGLKKFWPNVQNSSLI